ncbi:hypothetical protein [Limisalsivibrio acetivorans]|uniref:hypothetical protein n=1 Tax=Limisalsivibrio acetivorans TaxID=1304888 RepID=UPI0003B4BE33|nr:hypothetical protein [Limisalsivibrio acetivorans]
MSEQQQRINYPADAVAEIKKGNYSKFYEMAVNISAGLKEEMLNGYLISTMQTLGEFKMVDPNYAEMNTKLIHAMRENILIPMVAANKFKPELGLIARMADMLGIYPEESENSKIIKDRLVEELGKKPEPMNRIIFASILYLLRAVEGTEGAKNEFIKELRDCPTHALKAGDKNNSPVFTQYILHAFTSPNVTLGIFKDILTSDEAKDFSEREKVNLLGWFHALFIESFGLKKEYLDLYPVFAEMLKSAVQNEHLDLAFFLQEIMNRMHRNPGFETEESPNEIIKPLYEDIREKQALKPAKEAMAEDEALRIVFISDGIGLEPDSRLIFSLLKGIKENYGSEAEFSVINVDSGTGNATHEPAERLFSTGGFPPLNLHRATSSGEKGREHSRYRKALKLWTELSDKKPDVVVGMGGSTALEFVFSLRAAPKQIYIGPKGFRPENTDVTAVFTQERVLKEETGDRAIIPRLAKELFQKYPSTQAGEIKKKYSDKKIILGGLAFTLQQGSSEYLSALAEILKNNPDAFILFAGPAHSDAIKREFGKLGFAERIAFEDIQPQDYMEVVDVMLDPYPMSAFDMVIMARVKGLPVIRMEGSRYYDPTGKDERAVAAEGFDEDPEKNPSRLCFPQNPKEYVEYAGILINDDDARKAAGEFGTVLGDKIMFHPEESAKDFMDIVKG